MTERKNRTTDASQASKAKRPLRVVGEKEADLPDLPDLTGRMAVVTGANSGIGLKAAEALARAGAHVVFAVRDPERGRAAAATVHGSTEVRRLNLAELSSVREFAADWQGELHLLLNNAGVMMLPEQRTRDGFEMQFGTNHLGHFALTNLLLPHITDRVVTVASGAHRGGTGVIDFADLNRTVHYNPWGAYAQSKLANLLFTLELQRRLTAAGSPVRAIAAHPGYAATNLQSHAASPLSRLFMKFGNTVHRLHRVAPDLGHRHRHSGASSRSSPRRPRPATRR
jgi:NAD(P)-dependent dehydrogenase (short-subunit alcohol dehydrogenase family)